MLSNFQLGGQALLQIFLLGQPEFRDLLASPNLEQLRQRVIATHHLDPMLEGEIEPYVRHRLSLVGWTGTPHITADAFAAIHGATDGVPRRVNALMSRLLLLGAVDRLGEIDGSAVAAVVADMGLETTVAPAECASSPLDDVPDDEPTDVSARAAGAVDAAPAQWAGTAQPTAAEALELHRICDELDEMRRLINLTGDMGGRQAEFTERLDAIEARVTAVEERGDDQEAALRRVLTLLVDWVENDGQQGARAA